MHIHDATPPPQKKIQFRPQLIFYPLFLNEDIKVRENRLSKLYCRFRRYAILPKLVQQLPLESQCLQVMTNFSEFYLKTRGDSHNFAGIEIKTQQSKSKLQIFEGCVWYPKRRPCGVAINTLVDLIKLAGETPSLKSIMQLTKTRFPNSAISFRKGGRKSVLGKRYFL